MLYVLYYLALSDNNKMSISDYTFYYKFGDSWSTIDKNIIHNYPVFEFTKLYTCICTMYAPRVMKIQTYAGLFDYV